MIGILAHSLTGFFAGLLFLGILNVPLWVACLPSIMFMALLLAWKGLVECVYMLGAVLFAWILVFLLTMGVHLNSPLQHRIKKHWFITHYNLEVIMVPASLPLQKNRWHFVRYFRLIS